VTVGGRDIFSARFSVLNPLFICRIRRVAAGLADVLPQDFFYVHTARELDILTHQLQQHVFVLPTDRGEASQIDD
jgi:hypothetical protein